MPLSEGWREAGVVCETRPDGRGGRGGGRGHCVRNRALGGLILFGRRAVLCWSEVPSTGLRQLTSEAISPKSLAPAWHRTRWFRCQRPYSLVTPRPRGW